MTRSATIPTKRSNLMPLIAAVALIILALVVAVIAARPGSSSPAPAAAEPPLTTQAASVARPGEALRAKETNFAFGSISMAAGKVSHRYWFRNESAAPVLIKRIYTSCMCTTATFVKGMRKVGSYGMAGHGGPLPDVNESIAPNEAAYVDVAFDPAAHGPAGLGRTERVVTVEPASGEPLQLGFVANVTP